MNPFQYDVSLRIRHPKMKPEEISRELGMEPRYKWEAGTRRTTPKGMPLEGVYDSTYCSFELDHANGVELPDFLAKCNVALMRHRQFFERIKSSGGSIEYFIGWYSDANSGAILKSDLLKDIAALRVDVSLDIYGESRPKSSKKAPTTKKKKTKKAKKKK